MNNVSAFFPTPKDFRAWLKKHHASKAVLWVGYYKKATGKASITWPESVEEALCYGWIDGVRKKIDDEAYKVRFTPRRANSIWSKKNIDSVQQLLKEGRMQAAGIKTFESRQEEKSGLYSLEQKKALNFSKTLRAQFEKEAAAWTFFNDQPPGYKKTITQWVMSAKREDTQQRRFDRLLALSKESRRVDLLSPFGTSKRS